MRHECATWNMLRRMNKRFGIVQAEGPARGGPVRIRLARTISVMAVPALMVMRAVMMVPAHFGGQFAGLVLYRRGDTGTGERHGPGALGRRDHHQQSTTPAKPRILLRFMNALLRKRRWKQTRLAVGVEKHGNIRPAARQT